jgi:sugar/nucleoside kinase (ribokinase family)
VGDDPFGAQFRERLTRDGMHLQSLVVDADHPTAAVFIWYLGEGNRRFGFHLDGSAALSVPADVLERAPEPDWVHVSGATLWFGGDTGETCWRSVERALERGSRISFDPNVRAPSLSPETRRQFDILLRRADVVLASAGELEALGGDEAAITARGGAVVYKRGPAGATVVTAEGTRHIPAPEVTEIDPDGAGDIFAAGYVVAALAGLDPAASAGVAVQVASESVTVRGPLESQIDPLDRYLAGARR